MHLPLFQLCVRRRGFIFCDDSLASLNSLPIFFPQALADPKPLVGPVFLFPLSFKIRFLPPLTEFKDSPPPSLPSGIPFLSLLPHLLEYLFYSFCSFPTSVYCITPGFPPFFPLLFFGREPTCHAFQLSPRHFSFSLCPKPRMIAADGPCIRRRFAALFTDSPPLPLAP